MLMEEMINTRFPSFRKMFTTEHLVQGLLKQETKTPVPSLRLQTSAWLQKKVGTAKGTRTLSSLIENL